jgi:hypothetical protein
MPERLWLLGLTLALAAPACLANAGIAPLAATAGAVLIMLVPIVIVESLIAAKVLGLPARSLAGTVFAANVASTAAGLALASLETYWPIPFLPGRLLGGTVEDAVVLLLLLPLFGLSVAIEIPVWYRARSTLDRKPVRRAVVLANLASYLLMASFLIARIVKSAIVHGKLIVSFPP